MSNSIKSVNLSSNVTINALINDANVNINYQVSNNECPGNINVNANFNTNGASSSLNRNYSKDLEFSPKPDVEIYPFNSDFESSLSALISQVFEKFDSPESIVI